MAVRLFNRSRPEPATKVERTAIIDIGSNSIRLVVYEGPARLPAILFNEKVMAGLGRSLGQTGAIDTTALAVARAALGRFALLAREMGAGEVRTVATAAVRDASNGRLLVEAAAAAGLTVETLSGDEEAVAAGHGVLSAIPDADGIVGDLGGGSLELVRVAGGRVLETASFPLGVLRLGAIQELGKGRLDREVGRMLSGAGWSGAGIGLPFYLVGGSWRALARLDMHLAGYPLPVIHQYVIRPGSVARLARSLAQISRGTLRSIPNLSSGRIPTLGSANQLLASLLRHLGSPVSIVSAFGLREGLLYGRLDAATRRQDPLIVAARQAGQRLGRFPEHGDLLDDWIAPLFADDEPELARLRHAACLLADVGWLANPEFRAERGLEIALHSNWVAIDARGRALVAQALFTSLGGGMASPDPLSKLAEPQDLVRAIHWGLAMRLGQRLSGGVEAPLRQSWLVLDEKRVQLCLDPGHAPLYGEAVERRHRALANAMARVPDVQA